MKRVCVHGLGYIGLPTALLLADHNFTVTGVDTDENVVRSVNMARLHIVEKGLDDLLKSAISNKKLIAQTSPSYAEIHIICVPTPITMKDDSFKSDLRYVEAAIRNIATVYQDGDLVIVESTVSIGATDKMEKLLKALTPNVNKVEIVYCPERVLPGNLLYELKNNDRIIGGKELNTLNLAKAFYSVFVIGQIHTTNVKTAELSKLAENAYRDVNIAFANELSLICEEAGIDAYELINLINQHPRVNVLQPGIGVGGHCIAVDPWFIVEHDQRNAQIIKLARNRNLDKTNFILEKIYQKIETFTSIQDKSPIVGFLGLSYKPDIDDLRESPAVFIVREVQKKSGAVYVSDPNVSSSEEFQILSVDDLIAKCDLIFGLVAHREFKRIAKSGQFSNLSFVDFCGIKENSLNNIPNIDNNKNEASS